MNQEEKNYMIVLKSVSIAVDQLTDDEALAQLMAVQLGNNPKNAYGYEKIAYLYDNAEGTQMHEMTRTAFIEIVCKRFGL